MTQQRACQEEGLTSEKAYRKRTYSLTTPRQQRVPAQLSSASLDEYTLLWAAHDTNSGHHSRNSSISASPKVFYPESNGNQGGDDGYMPMMTAPPRGNNSKADAYMPMSPMCVSAPKQIIKPWAQIHQDGGGYRINSPSSGGSLEDSGYMRMWCSSKSSIEIPDSRSTYMNMSPSNAAYTTSQTPPDYFLEQLPGGEPSIYSADSLPCPTKLHQTSKEVGDTDD